MVQLKRIGVFSAAKIAAVWYSLIGLLAGAIFSLMAVIGITAESLDSGGGSEEAVAGIMFGVGAILCFPLMYGAMGFVLGALGSFFYNLVAKVVGGLELELGD